MGTRAAHRLSSLCAFVAFAACSAPDPRATFGMPAPSAAPAFGEQVRTLAAGSQPGAMHRRLDALVGDWEVTLADVDVAQAETVLTRGAARLEWVHGGRYIAWNASLDHAGTTSGYLGYDLRGSRYQLSMVSSLSTGMGVADGFGDLRGAGIRFTLENFDPASGQRVRLVSVLRSIDADHFVLESLGADERVVRRTHHTRAQRAR
jgi:hypothetical protein